MEWSLALVSLALIAVAATSNRLSGGPVTPAGMQTPVDC